MSEINAEWRPKPQAVKGDLTCNRLVSSLMTMFRQSCVEARVHFSSCRVGKNPSLSIFRLHPYQLPRFCRWNFIGGIWRYYDLKLCLIRTGDLHLELNSICLGNKECSVLKLSFHDGVVTIQNLNLGKLPTFRVHTDVG